MTNSWIWLDSSLIKFVEPGLRFFYKRCRTLRHQDTYINTKGKRGSQVGHPITDFSLGILHFHIFSIEYLTVGSFRIWRVEWKNEITLVEDLENFPFWSFSGVSETQFWCRYTMFCDMKNSQKKIVKNLSETLLVPRILTVSKSFPEIVGNWKFPKIGIFPNLWEFIIPKHFGEAQNCHDKKTLILFFLFWVVNLVNNLQGPLQQYISFLTLLSSCTRTKIQTSIWSTGDNFVLPFKIGNFQNNG